jgi:hypothetical protein
MGNELVGADKTMSSVDKNVQFTRNLDGTVTVTVLASNALEGIPISRTIPKSDWDFIAKIL